MGQFVCDEDGLQQASRRRWYTTRPQPTYQVNRSLRVRDYHTDANLKDFNAIVNENYEDQDASTSISSIVQSLPRTFPPWVGPFILRSILVGSFSPQEHV